MDTRPTARVTLQAAISDFLEDQEYKGNSPATLRYYRTTLARFLRDTGSTSLEELTATSIRAWLVSHRSVSRATLATYDRCLRVVTRWLYYRGYVLENPMVTLPKPKVKPTHLTVFTEGDIKAMLRCAKTRRNPLRDEALITLLLDTGLRVGEATGLQLRDIDWHQGWLRVDGKTGPRVVPFGRKTRRAVRLYVERERSANGPEQQFVFLAGVRGNRLSPECASQVITRLARAAEVKASKVGPHTFRHTFALEFIRAGGDAFSLQRILGHSTLDMTRKYVHLASGDLRDAHKRFAPADRIL